MIVDLGLAGADELAAGHALRPGKPLKRTLKAADVPIRCRAARSPGRRKLPPASSPAIACAPRTFTRRRTRACRATPADKVGVIEALRGCHVYPDTVAIGEGENPQWLYTVLFDGRELWGENADPTLKVSIEAFEPYLEPA